MHQWYIPEVVLCFIHYSLYEDLIFPFVSLSGVCQPADTDATVDAALAVGNTDVTRGQNFTHPKRTTSQPKPQQPLKGVKSLSSLLFFSFLLLLISLLVFSSFSSHLISFLLLVLCLLHSSRFLSSILFSSHLLSSSVFPFFSLFCLFSCLHVFFPISSLHHLSHLVSQSSHMEKPYNGL